jgi:hypothetical protein
MRARLGSYDNRAFSLNTGVGGLVPVGRGAAPVSINRYAARFGPPSQRSALA